MAPPRLVADIRAMMPDDGIIALDNGVYKIWFALNYPAHEPNTVLLDNALATMGAGLPSAMAAKIVDPNKKAVAICGRRLHDELPGVGDRCASGYESGGDCPER